MGLQRKTTRRERKDKLKKEYSPYDICNEANRLIKVCSGKNFTKMDEPQIICLLNKADTYPDMSSYQLSQARKNFADLYFQKGITGNALAQYTFALNLNPKLSIKRRLRELNSIPEHDLVYSLDPNISDEPDYSRIPFHTVHTDDDFIQESAGDGNDNFIQEIRAELHKEALEEDKLYDPEFEQMLKDRLTKLGEPYISEFFRLRASTENAGTLSKKQLDLLRLESMERSFSH